MSWQKSSGDECPNFKLGEVVGWINWDRLTRVERENPWAQMDIPATVTTSAGAAGSYRGQRDTTKGKGKNTGKAQKCYVCGGGGHYANECPKQASSSWGPPAQPMIQNWSQPVVHQPQVVAPVGAAAGVNTGGKGKYLAAQVNNVFNGKGGKPKAGGKGTGGHLKGY
jgi:hypothetical protein